MYAQMLSLVAPQLILTLGGIIMLMVVAYAGDRRSVAVNWLGIVALVAAIASVAVHDGVRAFVFAGTVKIDAYGAFAQYLIYGAAIVSLLLAPRYFEREGYRAEYPVLIVFAALGMGLMVSASDLMTLYIGLELNSLAAYVLASFARRDTRSSEAGLKYFVLGSLASGMLLYGMSLIYGFTGTTAFRGIVLAYGSVPQRGVLFGLVFTMVGLGFKISAVPFHMWTPDVYEGAPTPVTAFFASAPKVAAVALLVRVCMEALPAGRDAWQQIIAFMAVASMVFGAVAAIGQRNIKRLLAYSSIANVGFILVGLAAGSTAGVQSVIFYLTVYVVMTLGSFLVVLQLKTRDGDMVEDLAALAGLWRQKPWLAAALSIFMFSLAGIPPLFGFWPKLLVFQAAIGAGMTWLALVGAIASVIGAFYYLRVIKVMLFDPPSDVVFADNGGWMERLLICVAALYVSVLGFMLIAPLGAATARAAGALI